MDARFALEGNPRTRRGSNQQSPWRGMCGPSPPRDHSGIEKQTGASHKLSAARASPSPQCPDTPSCLMSLPDQTPKLPKLPFLIGDAVLLLVAWFIADRSGTPLSSNAIAGITACVAVGALLGVIPFLTDYARKQDEALDERQRGLEALSRTINTAAEQISIAANGLNELTDLTHKNLKHAEQLPHKLQDKVAEFRAQLDSARDDEREEMEKEIAELRASETERLQVIADKVQKAVAELSSLETATQKQLTARSELVDRASNTIVKAQTDAAVALANAVAAVSRELTAAQQKAVDEIDRKLAERAAAVTAAIAAIPVPTAPAMPSESAAAALIDGPAATSTPDVASPPRKPRKARREDTAANEPAAPEAAPPAPAMPEVVGPTDSTESFSNTDVQQVVEPELSAQTPAETEPVPIQIDSIPQIQPVAPPSADPFIPKPAATSPGESEAIAPDTAAATPPPDSADDQPTERPSKKRPAKKAALDEVPDLDPTHDDLFSSATDDSQSGSEAEERVISSDGATRLIATAYIGIGNRLFIRGSGPGLSWEKGVPLQFVSIGKWRWETVEASDPVQFKLYKNDEIECTGLGTITLDPGHQQEVTAKF